MIELERSDVMMHDNIIDRWVGVAQMDDDLSYMFSHTHYHMLSHLVHIIPRHYSIHVFFSTPSNIPSSSLFLMMMHYHHLIIIVDSYRDLMLSDNFLFLMRQTNQMPQHSYETRYNTSHSLTATATWCYQITSCFSWGEPYQHGVHQHTFSTQPIPIFTPFLAPGCCLPRWPSLYTLSHPNTLYTPHTTPPDCCLPRWLSAPRYSLRS